MAFHFSTLTWNLWSGLLKTGKSGLALDWVKFTGAMGPQETTVVILEERVGNKGIKMEFGF